MLSNMHSTTLSRRCYALKERALHLMHSRVFHSRRKLKYLFIHFRYISFLQLCFFASCFCMPFELESALHRPAVAKRASLHDFTLSSFARRSFSIHAVNFVLYCWCIRKRSLREVTFTVSCIMQCNPSALWIFIKSSFSSTLYFLSIESDFIIFPFIFLSPHHAAESAPKISTQSFFTAYKPNRIFPRPLTHTFFTPFSTFLRHWQHHLGRSSANPLIWFRHPYITRFSDWIDRWLSSSVHWP